MRRIIPLLAVAFLAACAGRNEPVVDMKGVDAAAYRQDLEECRGYAERVGPGERAVSGGVATGILGAALGAVVGAFGGGAGQGAALGAGTGGVVGAASGAGAGAYDRKAIVRNCLVGRGYKVLG
jgi:outer membrane lipoprotein SlyB